MIRIFSPKSVHPPKAEYSHAAVAKGGRMIFIAGQNGFDIKGNLVGEEIKVQTEQTLKNLASVLESCEAKMSDVVKTTIYMKDVGKHDEMFSVYRQHFSEPYPTCVLLEVRSLALKELLIEIDAIAVVE